MRAEYKFEKKKTKQHRVRWLVNLDYLPLMHVHGYTAYVY